MRHIFRFLLLLAMIRMLVGDIPNPVFIDDKQSERIRSKLTMSIIQAQLISNPVFVATTDIEDEVLKPLTELQDNNASNPLPLIVLDYDLLEEYSYYDLFQRHKPISSFKGFKRLDKIIRMMKQMALHENKVFTYIFLPPVVSYDGRWERKMRKVFELITSFSWNSLKIGSNSKNKMRIIIIAKEFLNLSFDLRDNQFLFSLRQREAVYDMFGFCYLCGYDDWSSDSLDTNLQINSWAPLKGFKQLFDFPSSFRGHFFGEALLINVQLHPSTIWLNADGDYEGPLYQDLDTIGIMMNFYLDINMVTISDCDCAEKGKGVDDDWRRARQLMKEAPDLKLLVSGKVDMVGGDYIATADAHEYADISAPMFYQEGAKIVSIEPRKNFRWYVLFQPFTWYTWILFFITIPICGLVLYLLRRYSNVADKKANYNDAMYDLVKVICWESISGSQLPISITLLLSAYILGIAFLITGFISEFTAVLITPSHMSPPIDTLEEFWSSDKMWLGGRMTDYYLEYFVSVDDVENRLHSLRHNRLILYTDEVSMVINKMIRYPEDFVYFEKRGIMEWNICRSSLDLAGRKIYYSKETIGDYNTHIYLQKNSVYTEIINRKILILQDMGIINHHQRRFANKERRLECHIEQEDSQEDMVALRHLKPVFGMLGVGYGSAFLYISPVLLNKVKSFMCALPTMFRHKFNDIINKRSI